MNGLGFEVVVRFLLNPEDSDHTTATKPDEGIWFWGGAGPDPHEFTGSLTTTTKTL